VNIIAWHYDLLAGIYSNRSLSSYYSLTSMVPLVMKKCL